MRFAPFVLAFSLLQSSVLVQAAPNLASVLDSGLPVFSQCGGIGWTGPTICASGLYCNRVNDYYFACFPVGVPVTTRY